MERFQSYSVNPRPNYNEKQFERKNNFVNLSQSNLHQNNRYNNNQNQGISQSMVNLENQDHLQKLKPFEYKKQEMSHKHSQIQINFLNSGGNSNNNTQDPNLSQNNDKQELNHIKRQLLGKNKEYDRDTIHIIVESLLGIPERYTLVSLHYIVVERNQVFQFGEKSEGRFIDNIKLELVNNNFLINQEFQLSQRSLLKRERKELYVFVKIAVSTDLKQYNDYGWTVMELKNTTDQIQFGRYNAPMYDINYKPYDFFVHSIPQINRCVLRYTIADDENKKLFLSQKKYDMQGIHLYRDLSFNKNQKIFQYENEDDKIRFQDSKIKSQELNSKQFYFEPFTDFDENKALKQYQSDYQDFQFQEKAYHKKDGKKKLMDPVPNFDQQDRYKNFGKDEEILKKLNPNLNNIFPFYQDTYQQLGIPNPRPGNILPLDVLQAPKNDGRKFQSKRAREEYKEQQRQKLLKKYDKQIYEDELFQKNMMRETTDSNFIIQQQRMEQHLENLPRNNVMVIENQQESLKNSQDLQLQQPKFSSVQRGRISKIVDSPQKNRRTLMGNAIINLQDPNYVDILNKSLEREDRQEIENYLQANKNEDKIIEEEEEEQKEDTKSSINLETLDQFEKENQYKKMRAIFQEKKLRYLADYKYTHFSYQVIINKLSHYKFKEWLKLDIFIMVKDKILQGRKGKDCKFNLQYYEEPKLKQVVFEVSYIFELDIKYFMDKNQDDIQQLYLIIAFYKQDEAIPFGFYSHQLFQITKQQANLLKNNSLADKEFAELHYQSGKFPKEKLFKPPIKYPPYKKDVRKLKKLDNIELDLEIRDYRKIQEHIKTQESKSNDDSQSYRSIPGLSHLF